jgi:hypothetical protein
MSPPLGINSATMTDVRAGRHDRYDRLVLDMRSRRAFVGAASIVGSYPLALAFQQLFGGRADSVIHLVTGAGFILFATSVVDFALPRWVNAIGGLAAGAFGAIFLLQGISDLTHVEGLRVLAFDVLGHHLKRLCRTWSTCDSPRSC